MKYKLILFILCVFLVWCWYEYNPKIWDDVICRDIHHNKYYRWKIVAMEWVDVFFKKNNIIDKSEQVGLSINKCYKLDAEFSSWYTRKNLIRAYQ